MERRRPPPMHGHHPSLAVAVEAELRVWIVPRTLQPTNIQPLRATRRRHQAAAIRRGITHLRPDRPYHRPDPPLHLRPIIGIYKSSFPFIFL